MKRLTCASIFVGALFCVLTSPPAKADNNGPSASGDFHFTLEDGIERSVEFNARIHQNGSSSGQMTFIDPGDLEDINASHPSSYVRVGFDCLTINNNRAVMSGVINESNVGNLIGHRVLLVVEDDGEGINAESHDKLTWGIYEPVNRNWIPQDAEVPGDSGWLLNWIATDFERTDDVGIPARGSDVIGCQSFSLSSYSFIDIAHGQGNIQVRP
ncbi:MAG: hypothetical protein ACRD9S_20415 [Pyrinomonadaceae bacterium]